MIQINHLIFLALIHFLADFGLQTHEQATNKGKSNKWLSYHVGVYSFIVFIAMWSFWNDVNKGLLFAAITFIFHFITDWCTSRIGKPFWEKGDLHNGFVVIGFDQLMHLIQLVYTFNYLNPLIK